MKNPNVDAVYIATPHVFHKKNTMLCLNNGIAVLCEKPFAMNLQEVEEMISCAKRNNVLLMEALWTYFIPSYIFVLDLVKHKKYGEIEKIEADFGFFMAFDESSRVFKKSLGGGSLLDIGIYPIFSTLSMLGIPNNIQANGTFYKNGVDSSCNMKFEYSNNTIAHLKSSFLEKTPTELILHCENAIIKLNSQFHTPTTVTINNFDKEETIQFDSDAIGYKYEIEHFNELLRNDKKESDIMTYQFSRNLIKTLDDVSHIIGLKY